MSSLSHRVLLLLLSLTLSRSALSHEAPPDKASREGESCTRSADCEGALRCVAQICVGSTPTALVDQARSQVDTVGRAVSSYADAHGGLPANLQVLTTKGFARAEQLVDPWGRSLTYRPGGHGAARRFTLCSRGADSRRATADDICIRR